MDPKAQQVVRRNIEVTGFQKQSRLIPGDALLALRQLNGNPFGLILLDPPYGGALLNQALERIVQIDNLRPGGIIVCESAREDVIEPLRPPYAILKEYRYGAIKITTITREAD